MLARANRRPSGPEDRGLRKKSHSPLHSDRSRASCPFAFRPANSTLSCILGGSRFRRNAPAAAPSCPETACHKIETTARLYIGSALRWPTSPGRGDVLQPSAARTMPVFPQMTFGEITGNLAGRRNDGRVKWSIKQKKVRVSRPEPFLSQGNHPLRKEVKSEVFDLTKRAPFPSLSSGHSVATCRFPQPT